MESNDRQVTQDSSIESHKVNYTLDGMEDGDGKDDVYSQANPARPGFTKSDQKDMWRMGKIQELKVSSQRLSLYLPCAMPGNTGKGSAA